MSASTPRFWIDIETKLSLQEVADRISTVLFRGKSWRDPDPSPYEEVPALELKVDSTNCYVGLIEQRANTLYILDCTVTAELLSTGFKSKELEEDGLRNFTVMRLRSIREFARVGIVVGTSGVDASLIF
jgi:hypothetical protein